MSARNWEQTIIRDPLYGFVDLTSQEREIAGTVAMQRLTRIKQLAHTYIVYPSAVHTRMEHSLGTLHIAGRIAEQLDLLKSDKQVVRLAALLHDVGHGPFSHLFESVMRIVNGPKFSHEQVTKLMIENDPTVTRRLGALGKKVTDVLEDEGTMSDIISSSLDADKMDYLRRDSYHTGVAYGVFDLERVMHSICKISQPEGDYIGITEKGMDCLEGYRLARFSMHKQVYEHHARLAADDMFVKAIGEAITEGAILREGLDISNPERFLKGYYSLDDSSIEFLAMERGSKETAQMISDIRNRKLLKRAFVLPLNKESVPNPLHRERLITMTQEEVKECEKKIEDEAHVEHNRVIVHLQSIQIKLYERFEESIGKSDKPILVMNRDKSVTSLDEVSPISASLVPIRKLFVFAPATKRRTVREAAEGVFKAKSIY